MGLTPKIVSHAIVTASGTHFFITENTNEILKQASLDDLIRTYDGSQVKVSSIMEILPITEYYNQYPEKKPAPEPSNHWKPEDFQDFRSDKLSRNGLVSMIRGIERAIVEFRAEGVNPTKALALLDKAKKAYAQKYPEAQ